MRIPFFIKTIPLLLLLPALAVPEGNLFAQQEECVQIEWSKHYGGSLAEQANEVRPTLDSGFIVAGFTRSSNQDVSQNFGSQDYWLLKLDDAGSKVWQKSYGWLGDDVATAVVQTPDGGYLLVGGTTSSGGQVTGAHGQEDVWVLRLDPAGEVVWKNAYGGSKNERAESVQLTADGGFVLAGYSQSSNGDVPFNHGDFDYWVFKIDALGNLVWTKTYGGVLADFCFDVRQAADGGYFLAGSTFSSDGDVGGNQGFYDYWLLRLDAGGDLVWESNFGGAGEERAYSLALTADGGAVVAGTSISSGGNVGGNNGSYDYWTMKVDAAGALAWSVNLGGSSEDRAFSVEQTADGSFLVAGLAGSSNGDVTLNYGSKDAWLVKLDPGGNFIWEKNFGGTLDDRFHDLRLALDGGYIAAGYSTSADFDLGGNFGEQDFWVVKIAPDSLGIRLGADTSLCAGATLQLQVEDDGFTYLWQDGSTQPAFTASAPGTYWLEVDKSGCKTRDSIAVAYVSEVPVWLGADSVLCEGDSLALSPGIPGADYLWQDGSSGGEFLVKTPGTFWVSVSKDGCDYLDTIEVGFFSVEVELGSDTLLCGGQTLLLDASLPGAGYLWQDGSAQPFFQITEPGEYAVRVGQGGCQKSDTLRVEYQFRPDTILEKFTFICADEVLALDAEQPGGTYVWQDGTTTPKFRAVAPGKFEVAVTLNGCEFTDELELQACERCLYVPNAFSPNGDGLNDTFAPIPVCDISSFSMQVFDRWGAEVFKTSTPGEGWDGSCGMTRRNDKAGQGSYAYLISFELADGSRLVRQERRGSVLLVR